MFSCARCVTAAFSYIEVLALSHEAFFEELHEFPNEAKIIKKASRWYGAKRAICLLYTSPSPRD